MLKYSKLFWYVSYKKWVPCINAYYSEENNIILISPFITSIFFNNKSRLFYLGVPCEPGPSKRGVFINEHHIGRPHFTEESSFLLQISH